MRIIYSLLLVLFIASVVFCQVGARKKVPLLSNNNVSEDALNKTVDTLKNGEEGIKNSSEQSESKGGVSEPKMGNDSPPKEEHKEGFDSDKKRSKEGDLPLKDKCDSFSNSCTNDDKTLVACLRVPGNESPDLSLLVQNNGKGPLTVTISATSLVQLEKKQFELKEKEDTEIKVSIKGVETGQFITLTAGNGNCGLDFRDQFAGRKKVDSASLSTESNSPTGNQTSTRFLFLAALLFILVSVLCIYFWRRYVSGKGPKYQKLDVELPVSHSTKIEQGANEEGWDDGWGDSWDDEEPPKTPSFPVTPRHSAKSLASRKLNKEGWKD